MVEKWCIFFKHAGEMNDADLDKLIANGDVIIKDAYTALDRFNWTEQELMAYEQELKRIWDNAAVEEAKLDAAEAKGREEGREEGMKVMVINMLKQNLDVSLISEITGLSPEEIHKLKS